jgi:hypothetical protein
MARAADKWRNCLQILTLAYIWQHLHTIGNTCLQTAGKSCLKGFRGVHILHSWLTPLVVQAFISELEAAASECGLRLKRLDKKSEKAALSAQKARLLQLVAPEAMPATALALAVPLLVLQHKHKLLSVPGRGISTVLQQLSGQLSPAAFEFVCKYHESVVESLKLQSGAGGEGEQQEVKLAQLQQQLEEKLPVLKALVGLGELPPELKGGPQAGSGEAAAAAADEESAAE